MVVQAPGNTNTGTATWTYNVPDKALEFLGAGETLTLTYMAEVDSNYAGGNQATLVPFTITITGTNDAPVITTGPENIAFFASARARPAPICPRRADRPRNAYIQRPGSDRYPYGFHAPDGRDALRKWYCDDA